jgi:hypothetical protein
MKQELELVKSDTEQVSDLSQVTINLSPSPLVMNHSRFAELTGFSIGVVGGWLDNGYLPTVKVGRYQLINLVQLQENLKQGRVL